MNAISYQLASGKSGEISDPAALRRFYSLICRERRDQLSTDSKDSRVIVPNRTEKLAGEIPAPSTGSE